MLGFGSWSRQNKEKKRKERKGYGFVELELGFNIRLVINEVIND